MRKFEQYQDMIARLFPELASNKTDRYGRNILSKVVTFQVTDACNLACTYCYQINKGERRMKFETAKKLIDMLLEGDPKLADYVTVENSPALVIEFIGGEPFLNVELMEQICDYFYDRAIELMHPWATKFCISICSNGVLYRDPKVQHFLNKYRNNMSFSVTIDGNKELHDACRVFPDGRPSYDLAVDAAKDWISRGYYMGSKITIAPGNLKYLCDAIFHIQQDLDYHEINANVVYEEGWTLEHATEYYYQLKRLADHWVDNNLVDDYYLALFEENFFKPKKEDDIQNWCFAAGTSILTPEGNRSIEDLLYEDKVIVQHLPNKIIENSYPIQKVTTRIVEEGLNINAVGMRETKVTKEHPYFARKKVGTNPYGEPIYSDAKWIKAEDLNEGDLIALQNHTFGTVKMDDALAYLLGLFIANGTWEVIGLKHENDNIVYNHMNYTVLCYDELWKDKIIDKLKENNISYHTTENNITIVCDRYKIIDTPILSMMTEYAANDYKIPKDCFTWDYNSIFYFISGFISSHSKSSLIHHAGEIVIDNKPLLCDDILYLIRSIYKTIYIDVITEYNKYYIIFDYYSNYNYDNNHNAKWNPITFIGNIEKPFRVYNLTVDTSHTFIANGAVVHNCGGTGSMLSMDPDGRLFPCIRYMESSLGDDRPPLPIGHVDYGIAQKECHKECIECLNAIDRRTQSTDECFYCPIAEGCSWCFPAGTKISTINGYINIEDIKPRMKVLSSSLKEQEVESNMSRISKDNYIIQPISGLSIYSTDEHPFYIMRNPIDLNESYVDWIKAKEIDSDTDKLAILVQDLTIEEVYKKTDEEYAMVYILGKFVANGYIRKVVNPCNNKIDIQYVIPTRTNYNEDVKVSNTLQYIPSLNYMIEDIIDDKYDHCINFVISKNDNIIGDIASSCLVYELIKSFTDSDYKKTLPEVITNNLHLAGAFISGFFNDHNIVEYYQSFFNKDKDIGIKIYNLIHRIQKYILYKNLNIDSIISNTNINLVKALVMTPIKDMEYDIRYPNIIWMPIKNIMYTTEEVIVYNMSVKNSHQYIANDILVHNCSAYNYQVWGTADKRATYICVMHKARALANIYFWNKWYRKINSPKRFVNYVPDKWALEIIPKKELDMLKELATEDY